MKDRLLFGVGVYTKGKYRCTDRGKLTREYSLWKHMLERCYCPKHQLKFNTYLECTVSEKFKNFQYFAEWCQSQVSFKYEGYQLDKDVISKGNKYYSAEHCVFIPREINMFLISRKKSRGLLPIGVCKSQNGNKYKVQMGSGLGSTKYLGTFETAEAAFNHYKTIKEAKAKQLALKYKGLVDNRVVEALNNYTVEITD